jgi:hypothetical protein
LNRVCQNSRYLNSFAAATAIIARFLVPPLLVDDLNCVSDARDLAALHPHCHYIPLTAIVHELPNSTPSAFSTLQLISFPGIAATL